LSYVRDGLRTTGDGLNYSQFFQVGPDGAYVLVVTCGVAKTTIPFSVTASPYVALGDSYASGEGASFYDPATNVPGTDMCHRAVTATAWSLAVANASRLTRDLAACSGSVIGDLYQRWPTTNNPQDPKAEPNADEIPQLDHVSRTGKTKLVTIGIGGNDVGFPSVLADCIVGVHAPGSPGCATRDQAMVDAALSRLTNGRYAGCVVLPGIDPDTRQQPISCTDVDLPALHTLYESIAKTVAADGRVVVAGYPHLFGSLTSTVGEKSTKQTACTVSALSHYIDAKDVAWLNSEAAILNSTIASEVAKAQADLAAHGYTPKVVFAPLESYAPYPGSKKTVKVTDVFAGHRICDKSSPWLHQLDLYPTTVNAPIGIRPGSFHPNDDGQSAYGTAVKVALK
jgi:hypothetical protein